MICRRRQNIIQFPPLSHGRRPFISRDFSTISLKNENAFTSAGAAATAAREAILAESRGKKVKLQVLFKYILYFYGYNGIMIKSHEVFSRAF